MAWLWYFFIGLMIYLADRLFANRSRRIRFRVFVGSGILAAVPAAWLGASGVAAFHISKWLIIAGGALAGALFFWTENRKWFEKFWLRFFLTPVLGVLSGVAWIVLFSADSVFRKTVSVSLQKPLLVLVTFFLIGLLTAFGYTLPERWFAKKEDSNTEKH